MRKKINIISVFLLFMLSMSNLYGQRPKIIIGMEEMFAKKSPELTECFCTEDREFLTLEIVNETIYALEDLQFESIIIDKGGDVSPFMIKDYIIGDSLSNKTEITRVVQLPMDLLETSQEVMIITSFYLPNMGAYYYVETKFTLYNDCDLLKNCKDEAVLFPNKYVESSPNISSLNVAPNPAKDYTIVTYELEEFSPVRIMIYNTIGQLVNTVSTISTQAPGIYQVSCDMANLQCGIYTIVIQTKDNNMVQRVIKM